MHNQYNITSVLFDLDGTIADTNELILRSMAETLERASGRVWQREVLLPNWGMRLREQLSKFRGNDLAIDLDDAISYYRQRYAEHHRTLLAEFLGVRDMLAQLRDAGLRMGVVTSKKHAFARQTIQDLGYAEFFPLIIAEEDTADHKPAPEPLLLALERLGVAADAAIYIGDNPDDIIAAHAAGMRGIAVGWSLRTREALLATAPDAIIDAPHDLLTLLDLPPVPITG